MNERYRLLKWIVVLVLVVGSLLMLYPPQQRLKGGIDLVGGASMIFEIDTAGMSDSQKQDLAMRVISILKARVDPNNQMNLVWRPIGNNRIEIQMPKPSRQARARRQAYEEARNAIQAMNITRLDAETAMNTPPEERAQLIEALGRSVAGRTEKLNEAALAFDAYQKVKGSDDVDAEYEALTTYHEAMDAVLDTSLDAGRLSDILALGRRERSEPLTKLKEDCPSFAQAIDAVVEKHDPWADEKGSLDDPSDLKRRIRGAGVLEFRILADRDRSNYTMIQSDDASLRKPIAPYVEQLQKRGPRLKDQSDPYRWFPIKDPLDFTNAKNMEEFESGLPQSGQIIEPYLDKYYVLVHNQPQYGLTKTKAARWELRAAYPSYDSRSGRPAVDFELDARGGRAFGELTEQNLKRQLCIFLDGVAMSHATIQSQIFERGQISGNFTDDEVANLVRTLDAGSLPARLKETPLMEKNVGPSLGEQNRNMGMRAAVWGLVLVAAFIVVYYLFAGLVADLALALNLLFVLAIMATLQATFTLPGIAGLILTVGMAVDANVLIFERIREERERGVLLRKALTTGYEKAFSTIVDANVTTLITCVILGYVGSEEVKGFAMTLGFGVVTSMFTALFVTRLVFTSLISAKVLKSLPMLRIIGVPKIGWLALRKGFWPISATAMIGGVALFAYVTTTNKQGLYDIEFLGGTSVQIEVKPGVEMSDEDVRKMITGAGDTEGNSVVAWLRQAADALESAAIEPGVAGGQFLLTTSDVLNVDQVGTLLKAEREMERVLARDGIRSSGQQVEIETRPVIEKVEGEDRQTERPMELEEFKEQLARVVRYVRGCANERLSGARVQTVRDIDAASGAPDAFEIVTVETNRDLVQTAIVAVLGDRLKVQQQVHFELVTDPVLAPDGCFAIKEEHRSLSDVVPDTAEYDLQKYKGGVVLVYDKLDPPQTTAAIRDRIREVRLLPEYEEYEWRNYQVIGLVGAGGEDDDATYSKVALVVNDENIFYEETDPDPWRQALAIPEKEQAAAAFESTKTLRKVLQFAPAIAKQAQTQATLAIILALAAIVAYVWVRFGTMQYGLAAIVALVHDVAITLGVVTLADILGIGDFRIDLAMIAALLTIIGYSLNDTIVVFDRIRENRGKLTTISNEMVNTSINQCLSRTLLTSVTTFIVVLVMYLFGGPGVHGFSFALLSGIVVGTYSSIFIAAPLLRDLRLLHVIVYILIAGGLFGLIAEISADYANRGVLLSVVGAVIVVAFIVVVYMENRSARAVAPAGGRGGRP